MNSEASAASPSPPDFDDFRRRMPVARRWAYLDHAAVAPLPEPARAAVVGWAEDAAGNGDTSWLRWAKQAEELRPLFARMIGAHEAEIALVRNTTEGISLVAEGYPWRSGDNVVMPADEFPSNQYPWMNLADRGVEVRRVATIGERPILDALAEACDRRTRILAISWVSYCSGWRHDLNRLAQLARDRGALLAVDAIQGLGVFPLDVGATPIDFLAADGHKWLLGPEGAGVLFVQREHLDRLRPMGVGWNSVAHCHDFTRIELRLKPNAGRYEGGSQNMVGSLALRESLKLLAEFGQAALSARVLEISGLACERLRGMGADIRSDRSPAHASGIVVFDLPGRDPAELRSRCLNAGVVLSCRAGGLRISPHAYNDASDIDRLIDALHPAR